LDGYSECHKKTHGKKTKRTYTNKRTTFTPYIATGSLDMSSSVAPDAQPPPEQCMERAERETINHKEVSGLYFGFCGPYPGCRLIKPRDDRGHDSLDGCFCCLFLVPIQKEFHRGPVTNGSPNVFNEWISDFDKERGEWTKTTHNTGRRLHIDNKCCNHETLCGTACPCCCAVKVIPC